MTEAVLEGYFAFAVRLYRIGDKVAAEIEVKSKNIATEVAIMNLKAQLTKMENAYFKEYEANA